MDPNINRERLPAGTCPQLMTKTLALNTHFRQRTGEDYETSITAVFQCLCTMAEYGPDERDAHPLACRPGRACWKGIVEI